jgi:hypothetical protein
VKKIVAGHKFIQAVKGYLGLPDGLPVKKLVIEATVPGVTIVYVKVFGCWDGILPKGACLVEDVVVEDDCTVVPVLRPALQAAVPPPPADPQKSVNPKTDSHRPGGQGFATLHRSLPHDDTPGLPTTPGSP